MSWARWVSTVLALMPRARAMDLVVWPMAMKRRISRWRGLSGPGVLASVPLRRV